jgi:hypothetical protein
MSFLFGKKNKQQQGSALPQASRELSSSHGPASQPPLANGGPGREPEKGRAGPPGQASTPGTSVNNSLSSLNALNTASPEPKGLRERSDSDYQVSSHVLSSSPGLRRLWVATLSMLT